MAVTSSGGGSGVNPQFSIDQLLCERNVLASLIYKMNNAHGRWVQSGYHFHMNTVNDELIAEFGFLVVFDLSRQTGILREIHLGWNSHLVPLQAQECIFSEYSNSGR